MQGIERKQPRSCRRWSRRPPGSRRSVSPFAMLYPLAHQLAVFGHPAVHQVHQVDEGRCLQPAGRGAAGESQGLEHGPAPFLPASLGVDQLKRPLRTGASLARQGDVLVSGQPEAAVTIPRSQPGYESAAQATIAIVKELIGRR